ncbi:hypothetical protein G6L13_21650 [Agrobacterium tumefaciens]|uniref:hypothetical protein n=1 Tax=Agrobacterium tumefaciens TaxID=358 RepID=UPI0015717B3B|nr:hypothetical protein [Agrobacterium tumefaciens]NTA83107.1 hypothetical protein [Agrobacterium tumefaciens]
MDVGHHASDISKHERYRANRFGFLAHPPRQKSLTKRGIYGSINRLLLHSKRKSRNPALQLSERLGGAWYRETSYPSAVCMYGVARRLNRPRFRKLLFSGWAA